MDIVSQSQPFTVQTTHEFATNKREARNAAYVDIVRGTYVRERRVQEFRADILSMGGSRRYTI